MGGTSGEFGQRIRKLNRDTPARLTGEVIRDQAYAQYQHETPDLEHPNGGQWKYQEAALLEHHPEYIDRVAGALLDGGTVDAMADAMAMFGEDSGGLAPKDFEILANSDRQRVLVDGDVVRDRPPDAPRLSQAELADLKGRAGGRGRYAAGTGPNREPPAGAKVTQKPRP